MILFGVQVTNRQDEVSRQFQFLLIFFVDVPSGYTKEMSAYLVVYMGNIDLSLVFQSYTIVYHE
jgi:hypothetical protein